MDDNIENRIKKLTKKIKKVNRKCSKASRRVTTLTLITGIFALVTVSKFSDLNKEIKELRSMVEDKVKAEKEE